MKLKILVTGGKGFIASHYINKIEGCGFNTKTFDLPENDIRDSHQLEHAIKDVDMVIHFAAVADLYETKSDLYKNHEINVDGTFQVALQCARQSKKLIFISTCCVYGDSNDMPEMEFKTAPMTNEPYACSKVAGEYIIRGMPNLNYCILRIGTTYGIGMRESLFTYIALDSVKSGNRVYIDGDGLQTRQLIHIDDLVAGICEATHRFYDGDFSNEMINLCGKEKISAMDTMRAAEDITGNFAIYEYREQRQGQIQDENISIERARELLNWYPKVIFFAGMKDTYQRDERFK
jgi:nucleoside-diphosphate-sugar epimerase